MSERTMEKARQVVHRLSEWYFAEGGDNDPDSPIDREDLDALHDLVRTAEATAEMERRQAGAYAAVAAVVRRELVAREVFALDADWRREYWDQFRREFPRQAQAYYDTADRILALLRTSRSEGEAREEPVYMTCMGCGQEFDPDDDTQSRYHEAACEVVDHEPARVEIARRLRGAALRSEAQGEEDVGEVCHLCGEEFDPRESGTVTGPLGQDDGLPRWYRCPRCARAYDAGYQQGQRDPRGDETADPTALRSEAQGKEV